MKPYEVTYDLRKPGQNYDGLIERLQQLKAVRVEQSTWLMRSTSLALDIANDLMRFMDKNDRLLVAEIVPSNTAWYNLLVTSDQINQKLAS